MLSHATGLPFPCRTERAERLGNFGGSNLASESTSHQLLGLPLSGPVGLLIHVTIAVGNISNLLSDPRITLSRSSQCGRRSKSASARLRSTGLVRT